MLKRIRNLSHISLHTCTRYVIVSCIVALITGLQLTESLWAAKFNRVVDIGQKAPEWKELPGVDGQKHALSELKTSQFVVVIFLRNHCPIAQAYAGRIRDLTTKYREKSVAVVGINVSDETGESLETMKAYATEHRFPIPYLKDSTQAIGKAYGATNTPHVFVLDSKRQIAYMGAIDDHNQPEKVTEHFLNDALAALLAGREVDVPETLQRGCQISYRE